MFKRTLTLLLLALAAPSQVTAMPVCYMELGNGETLNLESMCGGSSETGTFPSNTELLNTTLEAPPQLEQGADVWTRNRHFSSNGTSISGNVHNSGSAPAEKIVVEATGYASGRTPQTRTRVIPILRADSVENISFNFDFSVPVSSWDVQVVEWDE